MTEKMIGKSGPFGVGGVITGAMRCAVTEKEHTTGLEFDGLSLRFIGKTTDVMIAVSVAFVG